MKTQRNALLSLGVLFAVAGPVLITMTTFEWRGIMGWLTIAAAVMVLAVAATRAPKSSKQ